MANTFYLFVNGLVNRRPHREPVVLPERGRADHKDRHQLFFGIDPVTGAGDAILGECSDAARGIGIRVIDADIEIEAFAVTACRARTGILAVAQRPQLVRCNEGHGFRLQQAHTVELAAVEQHLGEAS